MKCLKTFRPALAAILAAGAAGIAHAQMPTGGPPGWNAAMSKLFGDMQQLMMAIAQKQNQKGGPGGKQ